MAQHQVSVTLARSRLRAIQRAATDELETLVSEIVLDRQHCDPVAWSALLQACARLRDLAQGKRLHTHIVNHGLENHDILASDLIVMYGKCGDLSEARHLLDRSTPSAFSCTAMIRVYTDHARHCEAMDLFHRMRGGGLKPHWNALIPLVNSCASVADLASGRAVHSQISDRDLELNPVLGNSLVSMYGRCGSVIDAKRAFDGLPKHNVIAWNAMLSAFARNNEASSALDLFREMEIGNGARPNSVTYSIILDSCVEAGILGLDDVKTIHAGIERSGLEEDVFVGTALVDSYGKLASMGDARAAFAKIRDPGFVSCSAIISACWRNGLPEESLARFCAMHLAGIKPSAATLVAVINACLELNDPAAMMIRGVLEQSREVAMDTVLGTTLVTAFARIGDDLARSRAAFDAIRDPDVVCWNAITAAHLHHHRRDEALLFFERMIQSGTRPSTASFVTALTAATTAATMIGISGRRIESMAIEAGLDKNIAVANAALNMHAKSGSLDAARAAFERIDVARRDCVTWNTMLACYAHHGLGDAAYKLFQEMEAEKLVAPNGVTLVTVLDAVASRTSISQGRAIHSRVAGSALESDPIVENALLNMYAKCGSLEQAQDIFESSSSAKRDVVAWTSLVAGYAQSGEADRALTLFWTMQQHGVRPNDVTLLSALAACNHGGELDRGCQLLACMVPDYGLRPTSKHFSCVVDQLGRCGRLDEAEKLLDRIQADVIAWVALLDACKASKELERGERCAARIKQLDPEFAASYIVLSSMYAAAGRWNEASSIRRTMLERGIRGDPGCSAVEVDQVLHSFAAGDKSHPRSAEIYSELERLLGRIREAGYVADTTLVLHNVSQEHKEKLLMRHSEKLAIVFGLLSTQSGAPLKVIKNLRVCSDCHTATKLISKVTGREILMRDSSRYHNFSDGSCSCGDYW